MIEVARNEVRYEGFVLRPCGAVPGSFDCGKSDLNEFFIQDQLQYEEQLLAKTYALLPEGGDEEFPKALISFCNDAIRAESFEDKKDFEKIKKQLPHGKRYNSLPAVKIARLGVHRHYQRKDVGTHLLNMTKLLFLTENRTGCRYITVDAYRTKRAVEFYRKRGGFRFMEKEVQTDYEMRLADPNFEVEDSDETVSLYYNLKWTQL
ncbi:MAG: GNAT family N-acetyltransferase [Deltaproteobacteria bacterium]|nr:GNAT family N-acetyltransferase [Deltaproteobacteria bacterium]